MQHLTIEVLHFCWRSIAGFEVVDWLDDRVNLCCWSNVIDDIVHALVGHRAFIQGTLPDRCGVDAFHLFCEFIDCEGFFGCAPAHQPAGAMWSREVPVRIAFSRTEQAAVSHVDWNDKALGFELDTAGHLLQLVR